MKLHWSPRSPYVRTVMIAAHELGLADRIETVRTVVGGTIVHRGLMEENPLGKIPTLVLPDGTILFNSRVICEYLDSIAVGARLPPAWPARGTSLDDWRWASGCWMWRCCGWASDAGRKGAGQRITSRYGGRRSSRVWMHWSARAMRWTATHSASGTWASA